MRILETLRMALTENRAAEMSGSSRMVRRGLNWLWSASNRSPVWTHRSQGIETRVHSSGQLIWVNGEVFKASDYPKEWMIARRLEPKQSRAMMKLAEILSANDQGEARR